MASSSDSTKLDSNTADASQVAAEQLDAGRVANGGGA